MSATAPCASSSRIAWIKVTFFNGVGGTVIHRRDIYINTKRSV